MDPQSMPRSSSPAKTDLWFDLTEERVLHHSRTSMLAFTKFTMQDFRINWHHRVLCKKLDDFVNGRIKRLMVFMPPRHGKSELVSRRLPALILGRFPDSQIIAASYGADLASRMNRDVQRVIDSEVYQRVFPQTRLSGVGTTGNWVRTSDMFEVVGFKGSYRSSGVGGGLTGMGGDFIIIDDPIKNQEEADSATHRQKIWDWWTSTIYTRLEKGASVLVTLTRWHEDDLAGRLIQNSKLPDGDQWEIVNFPALREDLENPMDPRKLDEPLWPWKYPEDRIRAIRASIGARWFGALYQQRPTPGEGNLIKREHWKYYAELPADFDAVCISADLTFKDGEKNDFAVFQVWARAGANKYLLDQVRGRMGFNEQLNAFKMLCAKWPDAQAKYIEDAANGAALVDTLKNKIAGIIPVRPTGSKTARAEAISPQIIAGNVYLPENESWVGDFVEEWAAFPNSKHDDQVDACSQALKKLSDSTLFEWDAVSLTGRSKWNM